MNLKPILIAACGMLAACTSTVTNSPYDLADPMVGTGGTGHTYPGATMPRGAVQLSPDTRSNDWSACAGYQHDDTSVDGFSHTHLSGTGCCDLGDIFVRPTSATVDINADTLYSPTAIADQKARPGYYSARLTEEGIKAELTATTHTGVHRYTFEKGTTPTIIFDLDHRLTDEDVVSDMSYLTIEGDTAISGLRLSDGWTPGQHVFFTARFSKPVASATLAHGNRAAVLTFAADGKPLEMVVGLSGVSVDNARLNIDTEVPVLDFDTVAAKAREAWTDALGAITVEGGSERHLRNFYSALYHALVVPDVASDVNGLYRRHNDSIASAPEGAAYYSTFSLWDTYRAWHPLMTIIDTTLVCDMVNSMLDMYDADGELPVWPLASGETGCMIGYHSVSVIADAYMKGLRCFDADCALEAMIESSRKPRKGADIWSQQGYIPSNFKRESVSCALEYSYDDWCIARMAEAMGRDSIAAEYYGRAANYANLFDGATRFFRGRRSDGNRDSGFIPEAVNRDLTEATSWHYRFAPVHDVAGMASLFGGYDRLEAALDSMFSYNAPIVGELSDITGIVGQYSHGNEPSHHVAYLYDYTGSPWKTQKLTRELLDSWYQPTPDGICGNEDCGQMSAWYIFSALGFYPVAPGSNEFALTTPLFERATIRLADGKSFQVTANDPEHNLYIESVTLNGEPVDNNFITYSQIMDGGTLAFTLTDTPVKERKGAAPYSMTAAPQVSVPYIGQDTYLFTDSITVTLGCATPGAEIRYTLDGTAPTPDSPLYTEPLHIDRSLTIRAIGLREGLAQSREMSVDATKAEFTPAVNDSGISNQGVSYEYYEGNCATTADITSGRLVRRGTMSTPSIDGADIADHFAFIFSGYIRIPATGIYAFRTVSDDGSVLYVDGRKVVDNDGGHAAVAATGLIPLSEGLHSFRILYFEDYEGQEFDWGWKRPGESDFTSVPEANLFTR